MSMAPTYVRAAGRIRRVGSELLVKEVMTRPALSIGVQELATKARSLMRLHGYRCLPVVSGENLAGVITDREILNITSSKSNILVRGLMSSPKIVAEPEESALAVGKKMIKVGESAAPVVIGGKKLVGIVSLHDILGGLLERDARTKKRLVGDVMSRSVVTCSPEDRLNRIWTKMESTGLSGLPVAKGKRVLGMITRGDVIKSGFARLEREDERSKVKKAMTVEKVMHTPAISVGPKSELEEAAKKMLRFRIGRLPVIDGSGKDQRLVGIIDREDIVKALL